MDFKAVPLAVLGWALPWPVPAYVTALRSLPATCPTRTDPGVAQAVGTRRGAWPPAYASSHSPPSRLALNYHNKHTKFYSFWIFFFHLLREKIKLSGLEGLKTGRSKHGGYGCIAGDVNTSWAGLYWGEVTEGIFADRVGGQGTYTGEARLNKTQTRKPSPNVR